MSAKRGRDDFQAGRIDKGVEVLEDRVKQLQEKMDSLSERLKTENDALSKRLSRAELHLAVLKVLTLIALALAAASFFGLSMKEVLNLIGAVWRLR